MGQTSLNEDTEDLHFTKQFPDVESVGGITGVEHKALGSCSSSAQ